MEMVVSIDNTFGCASAICATEAVHKKLVVILANVVRLHIHLEALDVVIGPSLVEVEKHARLRPVIIVLSVVAGGLLCLVVALAAPEAAVAPEATSAPEAGGGAGFAGAEASGERSNCVLHVSVVRFEDFYFIL